MRAEVELLPDQTIEARSARARREWNEAWSNLITARRSWQIIATIEAVALLVSIIGLICLARLPRQVPYVVQVDKVSGYATDLGTPSDMDAKTMDLARKMAIRQFITEWRTVTADQTAQVLDFKRSFYYLGMGSPAFNFLREWFDAHDPVQRALKGETVSVRVRNVEAESNNTLGVWFEEVDSIGVNQPPARKIYRARVTYSMRLPSNKDAREENPLGVLITELSVEEVNE